MAAKIGGLAPNETLANSIESWATAHQLSGDPYIQNIIPDLRDRKRLAMWASLDPLAYLPHAEAESKKSLATLSAMISIVRNVLVFAPVALTWIAISKATSAFAIYVIHNSTGVTNFLDFWQNGYGVLPKFWRIGDVALFDFLLIFIIIILTLSSSILDNRLLSARQIRTVILDQERVAVAIEISAYLFDKQLITNVTMNQSLATGIRALVNSAQVLRQTTKELNSVVKAIPSNRELLVELKRIKTKFSSRE